MAATAVQPAVYLDEEECLGVDVFVNELELLVATSRQLGKVDQGQLLELLPKLAATIPKSRNNKAALKVLQKRSEPAFTELIANGVCSTVRRLICVCLTRFYLHADMLSIYSRVGNLQSILTGKDPSQSTKPISDPVRVCMLEVLAYMALHHGRYLSSAVGESMVIAAKCVGKGNLAVRLAGIRLAANTVEGMNPADRAALPVQGDAWGLFLRCARDRQCSETRAAAAQLLSAIARAGGATLWRDGGYIWEEAQRVCYTNLADNSQSSRDAYAMALCDLATAVKHEVLTKTIRDEQRPSKRVALERLRADNGLVAWKAAIQQPLVEAALTNRAQMVASLCSAWVSYIGFVTAQANSNSNTVVDLAVQVVCMCDDAAKALIEAKAQGIVQDSSLGGALAGGEIPHAQAAALYVLRSAIIEALDEAGQRLLVQRLVALIQRPACPVPTAVVALEGLAILLDVLGEVGEETGLAVVEEAILAQVSSASTPVRQLASEAVGTLTAAQPASAARILTYLLEQLAAATELLGGVKTKLVGHSEAYDRLMGKSQPVLMATAHGSALAAASVLMVSCKLPLSIPSRLPRQAYLIATNLIKNPHSDTIAAKALEREAGYIVLGALISCWGNGSLSMAATIPAPAAAGQADNNSVAGVAVSSTSEEVLAADVLSYLTMAVGDKIRQDLDEQIYTHPGGDGELAMELWWRSVALQALRTYMTSLLAKGYIQDVSAQLNTIAGLLAPVLVIVDCQVCMHDPYKAKGGPGGLLAACSATFLLRLLQCVQLLELTRLEPASQALLIKMCSKPVKAAGIYAGGGLALAMEHNVSAAAVAAAAGYNPTVSAALHRTALRYCVSKEDVSLGPWPTGRDTAEDELHLFAGERGAPHRQPWEVPLMSALFQTANTTQGSAGDASPSRRHADSPAGMAAGMAAAQQLRDNGMQRSVTDRATGALYPQPLGLAPGLLAAQAAVLGRLLSVMSVGVQTQILEDLTVTASAGKGKAPMPGDRDAGARRVAASTLVAIAALSGLMPLLRKGSRAVPASAQDKLGEKILQLANALLDGGGAADLGIARAGAQLMAASACIGSDSWTAKVVSAIVEEVSKSVAEGRDLERRAALCLALGCIHRAKGGLALQLLVPASVGALLAAVKRPVGHTAVWALHALALCAASAGAGYVTHVKVTLQLSQELLVSGYEAPGLRVACARLANCMVGVLGPEFTLGSRYYRMAKSLTTDLVQAGILAIDDPHALMAVLGSPTESTGGAPVQAQEVTSAPRPISSEALACELQAVLFAQQAILFAPGAVQATKHVPMLQATLLSRRPALRKAAAATLFHLSERDPELLLPARIEGAVFAALDGETNASIAAHLRGVLSNLLATGCKQQPAHWLSVLSEVVFSSGGASSMAHNDTAATQNGDRDGNDDDDDGEHGGATDHANGNGKATAAGRSKAAVDNSASVTGLQAMLATVALRLRTRLFAADLLLTMVNDGGMPTAMTTRDADNGHDDEADSLVNHLQELVDVSYKLATGSVESLRPSGVLLLDALLRNFANVEDPLLPGACLLEQYQAQFVSALRAALGATAGPRLSMTGGMLATTFLESGLAAGDGQVLQRLMELLTGPLSSWGQQGFAADLYAEWVGVHQRVALLRAHAQCAALQSGRDDLAASIVAEAQEPYRALLISLWAALLQDYVIVSSQPPEVHAAYHSALMLANDHKQQPSNGLSEILPAQSSSRGPSQSGADLVTNTMSWDLVEAVRGVYANAYPIVLNAVTLLFPSATDVAQARSESGAALIVPNGHSSLKELYSRLLDVAVMLAVNNSRALAETVRQAVAAADAYAAGTNLTSHATIRNQSERLMISLKALCRLLSSDYVTAGLPGMPVVTDVLQAVTVLANQALSPMLWLCKHNVDQPGALPTLLAELAALVSDLLREIAQGITAEQLTSDTGSFNVSQPSGSEKDSCSIASALLECILATTSISTPYVTVSVSPKPETDRNSHTRTSPAFKASKSPSKDTSDKQGPSFLPAGLAALPNNVQAQFDQSLVSSLVAATLLLRKAPSGVLVQCIPALLQLCNRLLSTAPAGMQLQATHRFLGTLIATTFTTAEQISQQGGNGPVVADQCRDAACESLCTVTERVSTYLKGRSKSRTPDAENEDLNGSNAAQIAACITAVASCAWHANQAANTVTSTKLPMLTCKLITAMLESTVTSSNLADKSLSEKQLLQLLQLCRFGCEGLRSSLQEAINAASAGHTAQARWAQESLQTVGPSVASTIHFLLTNQLLDFELENVSAGRAVHAEAAVTVCEGLRALLTGASFAATIGAAPAEAVLSVLVALLVEAAAPTPNMAPLLGPAPSDMAIKLISSLPTSPQLGAPFRTAVTGLPASSKARLQAALQGAKSSSASSSTSMSGTAAGIGTSSSATKPTIQLKTTFNIS